MFRIGSGHDTHRLVEGRPLILGGVTIDHTRGLHGHSDADVVLHALTDAILGALALGDIGDAFPDTDSQWKDAESRLFLNAALAGQGVGYLISTKGKVPRKTRQQGIPQVERNAVRRQTQVRLQDGEPANANIAVHP